MGRTKVPEFDHGGTIKKEACQKDRLVIGKSLPYFRFPFNVSGEILFGDGLASAKSTGSL